MEEILKNIINYVANQLNILEAGGLIFGLLAVWLLIKENIWTWLSGIIYIFISFIIFWKARLYADLALHFVFLILNIYGWYFWLTGSKKNSVEKYVPVTTTSKNLLLMLIIISSAGIALMGTFLNSYTDASVPYWDSATTVLSLIGMWLTARKKIENWYFWFVVDVLATGIYIYKEIYFYAILYLVYVGMAISGYLTWKKSMDSA